MSSDDATGALADKRTQTDNLGQWMRLLFQNLAATTAQVVLRMKVPNLCMCNHSGSRTCAGIFPEWALIAGRMHSWICIFTQT